MNINNFKIIPVMDHYELYIDGEFICSGDSHAECMDELEKYIK